MSVQGWEAHALLSLKDHWSPPYTFFVFDGVWLAMCANGDVLAADDPTTLRLRVRDHYERNQAELKHIGREAVPSFLHLVSNNDLGPLPAQLGEGKVRRLLRAAVRHLPAGPDYPGDAA